MKEFNDRIAAVITRIVGTMWTAYVFCALSLVSLPAALASHDPFVIVSWISQSFLQLVLLPIILVGQDVIAGHHEKTHKMHREHAHKLDLILSHLGGGPEGKSKSAQQAHRAGGPQADGPLAQQDAILHET
jgi:hypothetical protein